MVKIQLDVPEELNKRLKIYAIKQNLTTKADAIVEICEKQLRHQKVL